LVARMFARRLFAQVIGSLRKLKPNSKQIAKRTLVRASGVKIRRAALPDFHWRAHAATLR
jgi:hypothetical protein